MRRIRTWFECPCAATLERGEATLATSSSTGAALSGVSITPPRGDAIRVEIPLSTSGTFSLRGYVVRHIGSGFAIEFDPIDEQTKALVDNAAALVNWDPEAARSK